MDYREAAIARLKGYAERKRSLSGIPQELRRLEVSCDALRAVPPVSEPGKCRQEAAIQSNLQRQQELSRRLEAAKVWCDGVESALSALGEEEQMLLDKMYIHRKSGNLSILCERLSLEKTAVYYHRDKALRQFQQAMFGI